jgi:hypothetical protein
LLARLPGLGDVHPPKRLRPIRLGFQLLGEIVEEDSYSFCAPVLDRRDGHAVDAGSAVVGGNVDPCSPHHVTADELVVKSVKPTFRVLLGTAVEHALERLESVHTLDPADGSGRELGTSPLRVSGCGRLI